MTYLTAKDVAQRLNIKKSTAYALLRSGEIACYRGIGGIRVTEQALQDYIARNTIAKLEPDILPLPPTVFAGHFAGMQGN